jgi:hypothetical protein
LWQTLKGRRTVLFLFRLIQSHPGLMDEIYGDQVSIVSNDLVWRQKIAMDLIRYLAENPKK